MYEALTFAALAIHAIGATFAFVVVLLSPWVTKWSFRRVLNHDLGKQPAAVLIVWSAITGIGAVAFATNAILVAEFIIRHWH